MGVPPSGGSVARVCAEPPGVPELPDVCAYLHALAPRIVGQRLERIHVVNAFVLRTVDPSTAVLEGRTVTGLQRVGKRLAIGLDGDFWIVLHLMIAGRLHWRPAGSRAAGRNALAAFDFAAGVLTLTEAGTKRRAALHLVEGRAAVEAMNAGGIDVLHSDLATFRAALSVENRTLKRALTDPRIVDGIGNAYSDEILHAAKLSPVALTQRLKADEWSRLYDATRATLTLWIDRLRAEAERAFPEHVTAFRDDMAVHGKFGQPCPRCASAVARIRYADNETNYCPVCQNGGVLLADRSLSRLLGADWPRNLDELDGKKGAAPVVPRPVAHKPRRGS